MSQPISTTGWAAIILFILFVVGLNISLLLNMRKKKGQDHWTDRMRQAGEVIRDPWKKENEQMTQLSEKVKKLNSESRDHEAKNS